MPDRPATKAKSTRRKHVRLITDKRKEQNRRSQKVYREKVQKRLENLERLERQVKTQEALRVTSIEPEVAYDSTPEASAPVECPIYSSMINLGDAFKAGGDLPVPTDSTLPILHIARRPRTPTKPPATSISPPPSFWHASPAPLYAPNSTTTPPASTLTTPFQSDPSSATYHSASSWPGFSLHANFLRLQGENCFAATLSIAASLGISQDSYVKEQQSPFYLSSRAFDSGFSASGTSLGAVPDPSSSASASLPTSPSPTMHSLHSVARIKPDLRPSSTQLLMPHPSYLDCIIFPSFRDRAIELSASGMLDGWELFVDLVQDGLVCWGSVNRGGMENGVAWSMRSWEARPWFLKKWWFLAGGENEEVWQGSRWWWSMRGKDVGVDEVLFVQSDTL